MRPGDDMIEIDRLWRAMRRRMMSCAIVAALWLMVPGPAWAEGIVRVGATATGLLVWLADELGYLAEAGDDIALKRYSSGTITASDLKAGKLDLATSSEFAFVTDAFERSDLRILCAISASRTTDLIARRDRSLNGYADLVGKRVGITKGGIGEYFLGRTLLLNGIASNTVDVVPLAPPDIVIALEQGRIDAGLTWEPFSYEAAQKLKDNHVVLPGQGGQDFYFLFYTTEAWLEKHRGEALRLVDALARAAEFARNKPAEAKRKLAAKLNLDPAFLEYVWPKHTLELTLSQDLLRIMEDEASWRLAEGLSHADKIPNYLDMIHRDTLAAVVPDAVTLINPGQPFEGPARD
jgi:ABC-type nitrate/sulfonate/bicarbonate transport system substrate-binding protein